MVIILCFGKDNLLETLKIVFYKFKTNMVIILKQNSNKIWNSLCLTLRLAESHIGTRRVHVVTRRVSSNRRPEFDFQLIIQHSITYNRNQSRLWYHRWVLTIRTPYVLMQTLMLGSRFLYCTCNESKTNKP